MKYILTSPKFSGEIVLDYALNGYLIAYSNSAEMNETQLAFWIQNFPLTNNLLKEFLVLSKTVVVKEVPVDLSFTAFWETYGHKTGNKKRSEKLWNGLTVAEKLLVITDNVKAYKYYLACKPNLQMLYPETYLSQRRFETNYKELLKK